MPAHAQRAKGALHAVLSLAAVLVLAAAVRGQAISLERPADRTFVVDRAGLIEAADAEAIESTCDAVLRETASPIIVVTIESMATYSRYGDVRIETFAHLLFDQWEIGHVEVEGKPHNRSILVLVARDDRKARIQLGDGWGAAEESRAQEVMDSIMVPAFKRGEFSRGIREAVDALASLARGRSSQSGGEAPPSDQRLAPTIEGDAPSGSGRGISPSTGPSLCPATGCGGGLILLLVMLGRLFGSRFGGGGSQGRGPMLGGMLGGGRGSSSGGFSGGSFGGGFSGGRGASGSW